MPKGTLLVVDDNKNILTAVRILLADKFERIITLSSPNTLLSIIQKEKIDVVLLDMNFAAGINSGNEGIYWLNEIKSYDKSIPVVLFTAYADIQIAVKGIKEGAFDFIVKPWDNAKLIFTLQKALETRSKSYIEQSQNNCISIFWGNSEMMKSIKNIVERIAPTNANILITGENGTGKEILAREIHRLSLRRKKELVVVDMGALTDTLFESELFGHVKGSFTDAHTNRIGRFESAHESTLFLDEIGNISIHQQAKLLTAIQQHHIIKVGTNEPINIDIRLICATNRNLSQMIDNGSFREDLLYRINTVHLEIPPLRDRKDDIIPLANIFLKHYAEQYKRSIDSFSDEACELMRDYTWHGNIRELQHVIEKAIIISENPTIDTSLLSLPQKSINNKSAISNLETLEDMEKIMIQNSLIKYNSNLSIVASKLGISRQTLYNKMKRYGL